MPRSARLNIAGVLQHVMVRGIEKRDIFLDDRDRSDFLGRLSQLLLKTRTDCLAWAILSNHVHLLLRPTQEVLSEIMQRLLTGYAVAFNLRHRRCGHLFQNRYKSIVCEEETYLLELVRYIHLNPIRAGLVASMLALDSYKWCGHGGIMGVPLLPGQVVEDVLLMFDDDPKKARKKYRAFVADGVPIGRRDELVGGGLKRHLKLHGTSGFEVFDERILGSGEFVEHVWHETTTSETAIAPLEPLDAIMERVAFLFDLELSALQGGNKQKQYSDCRAAICYIATRKVGYRGVEVSKKLAISKAGVVAATRRGEALFRSMPKLREITPHFHLSPL